MGRKGRKSLEDHETRSGKDRRDRHSRVPSPVPATGGPDDQHQIKRRTLEQLQRKMRSIPQAKNRRLGHDVPSFFLQLRMRQD